MNYLADSIAPNIPPISVQSVEELEAAVRRLSESARWISLLSLCDSLPETLKAPLFIHHATADCLIHLNLLSRASTSIEKSLSNHPGARGLLLRRLGVQNALLRWDRVLRQAEADALSSPDEKYVIEVIKAARETRDVGALQRLARASPEKWTGPADRLSSSVAKDPQAGFWRKFHRENRNAEFLSEAIRLGEDETDFTTRVIFIRLFAAESLPHRPDFCHMAARSLLHRGQVDLAFSLIAPHVDYFHRDSERETFFHRVTDLAAEIEPVSNRDVLLTRRAAKGKHRPAPDAFFAAASAIADGRAKDFLTALPSAALPVMPTGRLRVAICISGQLRGFSENWPVIQKTLQEPFDADIFVSTWDSAPAFPPRFVSVNRFFPEHTVDLLPQRLRSPAAFSRAFPRVINKLTTPVTIAVSEGDLYEATNAKLVQVLTDKAWIDQLDLPAPLMRQPNQLKMFYQMYRADQLRTAEEAIASKSYDLVIKTRPDLQIEIPNLVEIASYAATRPHDIFVSYVTADGCGDQFALGSPKAMSIYAGLWPHLTKYGAYSFIEGMREESAEIGLGQYLLASGLSLRLLPVARQRLESGNALRHVDVTQELRDDAAGELELAPFVDACLNYYQ